MMRDYILRILTDYRADLKDPRYGLSKRMFVERSTRQWAIDELIYRVKNYERTPIDVIEMFIRQMDRYYKMSNDQDWITAKKLGEDVLDIIYAAL